MWAHYKDGRKVAVFCPGTGDVEFLEHYGLGDVEDDAKKGVENGN
jgi:hypothetical protein